MNFTNFNSLQTYIQKSVGESVKAMEKFNEKILSDAVQTEVYSAGQSNYRTGELKKSATSTTNNVSRDVIVQEVFVDPSKLSTSRTLPTKYSFGEKYAGNTDARPYIAEIIERGKSGHLFGKGFWNKPRKFISKTRVDIQKRYVGELKQQLRKHGIETR